MKKRIAKKILANACKQIATKRDLHIKHRLFNDACKRLNAKVTTICITTKEYPEVFAYRNNSRSIYGSRITKIYRIKK